MGRGSGATMRILVGQVAHDRWQPVAHVIERAAAATGTQPRTVEASLRRLERRDLVEVAARRVILPELGGNDRLVRRPHPDHHDDAIAQHSALVRVCYDELVTNRATIEMCLSGERGDPHQWWDARDRAEELRRLLGRIVGRRELRRLLRAAGYPADSPLTRPMGLWALQEHGAHHAQHSSANVTPRSA